MADALKPWPNDAVMVVAATPDAARRDQMESVHPCNCRDCGKALVADGYTLRIAASPELAWGRPTKFFCVECCQKYDFSQVTHSEDHRFRKGQQG